MDSLYKEQTLHFVGSAINEGQTKTGVEKAPQAIRDCGLFNALKAFNTTAIDHGDVSIKDIESQLESINEKAQKRAIEIQDTNITGVRNLELLDSLLYELHKKVKSVAEQKNGFVVNVGGDHSVATGSISAMRAVYPNLKVIWIDAHPDAVTPSMSGKKQCNYHGMPASHLMGWLGEELPGFDWLKGNQITIKDIVYIGIRDIDNNEKINLKKHGIKCFTPDHIFKHGGIGPVMDRCMEYLDPNNEGFPIWVSFDVDGMDPEIAPGTGTRAQGGLNYRESHYILRYLADRGNFVGMDLVEINPDLDPKENKEKLFGDCQDLDGTQTVVLGCDLILSCLGRTNLFLDD